MYVLDATNFMLAEWVKLLIHKCDSLNYLTFSFPFPQIFALLHETYNLFECIIWLKKYHQCMLRLNEIEVEDTSGNRQQQSLA